MADDPVARRMIADLQQQIAAMKQRTAPMGTGLGTFVGTQYQQNQTWNRQVGFPAELTSTFDPVTGYSWKALARDLAAPELTDPTPQNIGDNAIAIDGDETLTVGTRVWLEPDPMGVGYELQLGGGGGDALGCSAFASLEPTSCLSLSVRGVPSGRCEDVDPDQTIILDDDDEDGTWVGSTQFVTDTSSWDVSYSWPAGDCCPVLMFDNGSAVSLRYLGCDNGKLLFVGSGETLCGQAPDIAACSANSFVVQLECIACPNPDYNGPGWYCQSTTGCGPGDIQTCIEYLSDPGPLVTLCAGPFADETECIADPCNISGTVTTACSSEPVKTTLVVTFTSASGAFACLAGVAVPVVWNGSYWRGCVDGLCSGGMIVGFYCDSEGSGRVSIVCYLDVCSSLTGINPQFAAERIDFNALVVTNPPLNTSGSFSGSESFGTTCWAQSVPGTITISVTE
jgi:hypothetical protein